ncbi:MAG: phosphoglycerate kinase [Candidatus Pacebacteria bacterium]|nr:phosphoglycerate kinase [Candidatus Paceibacterota bacterium]
MMKTLKDLNFENKKTLVRCDFNVPLDSLGNILDDYRILKSVPIIKYLAEKKAKVILMSHLDDPGGKIVESLRLDSIQKKLTEYLGFPVIKVSDCIGLDVQKKAFNMKEGEVLLLENLRFHSEEEKNDDSFAKELSKLGEIYINDAFSCSHRAHASIAGVPKYLEGGIGFLFEKEIEVLDNLFKNPKKPQISIVGGKKVETKTAFLDKISENSSYVLVGGLIEKEIKEKNIKLKHPEKIIFPVDDIDTFDIGPKTLDLFKEKIKIAKTIIWNGPLGQIEKKEYSNGSLEIAKAIIESRAFSVAGGGETVEFINKKGLSEKFSHLSTGGGAMIAFLAGEKLPGIEVLR